MRYEKELGPATVVILTATDEIHELHAHRVQYVDYGQHPFLQCAFAPGEADCFTGLASHRIQPSVAVKLQAPEACVPILERRTVLCDLWFPVADRLMAVTARTIGPLEAGGD